jgi:fibronectin type 3 domain-containing protein/GH18 family chitinase
MKRIKEQLKTQAANISLLALVLMIMSVLPLQAQQGGHWLTGYFPVYLPSTTSSYQQNGMTPSQLDYTKLTHIIYWGVMPANPLNPTVSASQFATNAKAIVANAHAVGTKALLGIGGDYANGYSLAFNTETKPANLSTFVSQIVAMMQLYNFDGVDINWEMIGAYAGDNTQFPAFIAALRTQLDTISPKPLLTMSPETELNGGRPDLIGPLAADFAQINIQTYLMSFTYCGWETYFNSPLSNGGQDFLLISNEALPSVYQAIAAYTSVGVPISELGMGMQLGGVVWKGGSGASLKASGTPSTGGVIEPYEIWGKDSGSACGSISPDAPTQNQGVPYSSILSQISSAGFSTPVTDPVADQTWTGFNASNGTAANEANDLFISYESPDSIAKKGTDLASPANQTTLGGALGGIMLFELSGDFTPSASGDAQHPLITAASQMAALLPGTLTGLTVTVGATGTNTATLNWTATPGAASYNVYTGSSATGTPVNTAKTTLALSNLTPGASLEYYVEAVDAFGTGTGATVSFTNPGNDVPTGLTAMGYVNIVSLSWNPVPNATSYNVKRATASTGPYSLPVSVTRNSFTDDSKTLVDGTRYYYVVTSTGSWGTSAATAPVSAIPVKAPVAPTNLMATTAPGEVKLTWNPAVDAYTYMIFASTSSSSTATWTHVGTTTAPSFTYSGNFNGTTTYYFIVYSVTGSFASAPSSKVSATPPPAIPGRIGTPVAVAGADQVTVTWFAETGATGYYVLRSTTSGSGYTKLMTASPITTPTYTDTTAYDGLTYYYVVEAYNASGTSAISPQASATPTIPAPTGLGAVVNTNVVTLTWNAVPGVLGYEVLRGTANGGPYNTEVGSVNAPTVTLNDTTAIPGTPYYYVVEAYYFVAGQNKPATFSPNSNQVEVTVTATKLAAPTGLQAFVDTAQGGPPSVNLGWTKEAGVVTYNILRSTTNGGPYSLEATSPYAQYLGDPVNPGTTYYYVVQAVNGAGTSGYSNQATAVIPKATIPATPIFTIGVQNGVVMVEQLDGIPGATAYQYYRATSATGTYTKLYSGPNVTYNDTTAVPGTTYFYEMTASNSAGTSPISASQSALVPLTPAGLKATAGSGQVVLTWNAVAGASGYNVQRGTVTGTYSWFVGSPTTNSITDTTVTNGTTYFYVVQTIAADGFSTGLFSAPASATPISSNVVAPTGLTSTTVNAAGAVTLSWTASAGSAASYSYSVYGGNTPGGESTTALATVTANATTATITGLASNKTWYFVVKAANGGTPSNPSNEATALPRIVYVPSYEAGTVNVRIGGGTTMTSISFAVPTCNPNSLAINQNKLYVVCSLLGDDPDKILVYNAATIRAAAAGTLTISPIQTITSGDFNSLIGIAFDASNDLWVASNGNNNILEFTAAELETTSPADIISMSNSPGAPAGLAFDTDGSLWITGEYQGGIVVNFTPDQFGTGSNANPRYCLSQSAGGPCIAPSNALPEYPEGIAIFGGSVWVANNSTTGSNELGGATPGRELINLAVVDGALTIKAVYGKTLPDTNPGTATSPLVCPGGLFASPVQLWVNDESYGETNPACGANGDVTVSNTGGVFAFTAAELAAEPVTQAPVFTNITGRQGFGGVIVENDR